jgi:hypothetical protein
MNPLLTRLGISPEIQAFFNISGRVSFDYGDQQEHYSDQFHVVPSTHNLWMAGNQNATHVIISYSAMEAMAYIMLKRHHYPRLEQLAIVAIGNRFHTAQSTWMRDNLQSRKFTLVFGNDLVGRITDIKLAAGIKNIPIRVFHSGCEIQIQCGNLLRVFDQEQISLHFFQEAFGIRPRFRTGKPVQSLAFLDQLRHDTER